MATDCILLAKYISVKNWIKDATESRVETEVEDFIRMEAEPTQALYWKVLMPGRCSLIIMMRMLRSRSAHSRLRLVLYLDRALVPMVLSGSCRQRK